MPLNEMPAVHIAEYKVSELRTLCRYYGALHEVSNDLGKSAAMVHSMINAELERKYSGIKVIFDSKRVKSFINGFHEVSMEPYLVLMFDNQKSYNKFKLVEGLVGKD